MRFLAAVVLLTLVVNCLPGPSARSAPRSATEPADAAGGSATFEDDSLKPDKPDGKKPSSGDRKPAARKKKSKPKSSDDNADADSSNKPDLGPKLGDTQVQQIKIGISITAEGGACEGIVATTPVPIDWAEQQVKVIEQDVSASVRDFEDFRMIDGTVKQMVLTVPYLAAGEEAHAILTFEVTRRGLVSPDNTAELVIPKKLDRQLRTYLAASLGIEVRSPKIRALAKEIAAKLKAEAPADGALASADDAKPTNDDSAQDAVAAAAGDADDASSEDAETADAKEPTTWQLVEAMYDWVRDNIQYKDGPFKGAMDALKVGHGDCEELSSLFIALCRSSGIPARTVWVPGHCYAEFYLTDAAGNGYWFPCQAAGSRDFGGIAEHRPILQKGDNFSDPDRPGRKLRYVSENLKVTNAVGKPRVKFIREPIGIAAP
jgi:hypothetical protein